MSPEYKIPNELNLSWLGRAAVEEEINALSEGGIKGIDMLTLQSNGLEKIPRWLERFTNLRTLDLSSNRIAKLEGLENLVNLHYLYIDCNRITKIEGLDALTNLRALRFGESFHYHGGNEIRKIENLEALINLEVLELANNKVQKIENFDSLKNLEELDLSSNQIEEVEGLGESSNLKILHLGNNNIRHLDWSEIPALEVLCLGPNPIQTMTGYEYLKKIKSLFMNLDNCDLATRKEFHSHFRGYEMEFSSIVK